MEILFERADRHEVSLSRVKVNFEDLENKLKGNIESLLYRLFPEGPSRKERSAFRFGSKGSLKVECSGDGKGEVL